MSGYSTPKGSPNLAWQRAYKEFFPSKWILLFPVNQIYAHVKIRKMLTNDRLFEGLTLATILSEENHYLNTISLLHEFSSTLSNLNKIIRSVRVEIDWQSRLADFYYVGSGTYGSVFLATDTVSDKKIVMKNVVPEYKDHLEQLYQMSKIFQERNVMISANECPFMIHLLAAFKEKTTHAFWNIIYHFEILCALDYLATRHIVHADIKAANILISTTGHAKLSDLGCAQRFSMTGLKITDNQTVINGENVESTVKDVEKNIQGKRMLSVVTRTILRDKKGKHDSLYFVEFNYMLRPCSLSINDCMHAKIRMNVLLVGQVKSCN